MNRKGFTLIEVAIALVIVLLIISALTVVGGRKLFEGYQSAISNIVVGVYQGIQNYYRDVGSYPRTLQDLKKSTSPNWVGPYIQFPLKGNNLIELANGKIKISYTPSFSGRTDCGYMRNRPAIIVYSTHTPDIVGLCKSVTSNRTYYVLPP
jgi:prepilin-type N-terminal cleavage/methylation domain-containing protein